MTHVNNPTVTVTDADEATAVITGEFDMPATFTTEPALDVLPADLLNAADGWSAAGG